MMKTLKIALTGIALLSSAGMIVPASAATTLGVGLGAGASVGSSGIQVTGGAGATLRAELITRAENRADQEISRRINALNALIARINNMRRLSSSDKSGLAATIQSQITLLQNLQAQIAADAQAQSTSSLKTDIQSITKAYRIFMLVIPQGALEAAADRILNVADAMSTLAGKLQTRVSDVQAAGKDTSSTVSVFADMNAKIADAKTQDQAAVTEVSALKPDNGDQTVMQANVKAMQDARSKIRAAQQDLVAARKDAGAIVRILASWNASAESTTTFSATTSSE